MKFPDIDAFLAHLATLPVLIDEATHAALEECAEMVEKEAKAELGIYQSAAGPFAHWAPLADVTRADRVKQGFPADEPLLRTGELRDSISHSVDGDRATIGSDSAIATYQEQGTKNIPPRPFLGPAVYRNEAKIIATIGLAVAAAMSGSPLKK